MSFQGQLEAFAAKTKAKADTVVRKTVFDVGASLVYKSPVGDGKAWKRPPPKGYVGGQFRGSWQYGSGSAPSGNPTRIDGGGEMTLGAIATGMPKDAAGKVHYIVNNQPYGPALEEGWSGQAPNGMVGLTVTEFGSIVDRNVREAGK